MKRINFGVWLFAIVVTCSMLNMSCSKDDPASNVDPLVGSWVLRGIYNGQELVYVTNRPCFQDSRLVVTANNFKLTLVGEADDGDCRSEELETRWVNKDGVYYFVNGDEQQPSGITLSDENQTLQLNAMSGGQQIAFIFRK